MRKLKRWIGASLGAIILFGGIYIVFNFVFLNYFVDYSWFQSLGLRNYYLQRILYRYATFGGVSFFFFLLFFLNFWLASRFLGGALPEEAQSPSSRQRSYKKVLKMIQVGSMKIYTPISLVLSIPIAWPFWEQWQQGLLFFFGAPSGVKDAIFGKDISFYLFSFPIYVLIQNKLLLASLILIVSILFLYWIENRLLRGKDKGLPRGAKVHIVFLLLITVGIQICGFFLKRYGLVFTSSHQPLFYGPGYTEMRVILPSIWTGLVFFVLTAVLFISFMVRRKGLKLLVIFILLLAVPIFGLYSDYLPNLVQTYWVKPSESTRERPYINNHIQATLAAYNLNDIETRQYEMKKGSSFISHPEVQKSLHNFPVWDRELLDDRYKQLQGIKAYYDFPSVDVDRYNVSAQYQQVYLAARELDLGNLPKYARNWANKHLQYTHGYGVVMTPAAQGGDETMTLFMQDMPMRSKYGLETKEPRIYYGLGKYGYAIAPSDFGEVDYPQDETNVLVNYAGKGGVPLSSMLRKLLFAVYFQNDWDIVLTAKTNSRSRLLFRRNIRECVTRLTPFFLLDSDPYLVVTEEGLFWIQDAYTTSDKYPGAQFYNDRFNYIRNSVKIVIDAYNGSVEYFVADQRDPLIRAYQNIYPNLLKPLDQMPEALKAHIRYPRDLFEIQMNVYARYHQTDPEVFYRQEDSWEIARIHRADHPRPVRPYYVTLNILDRLKPEFMMLAPMNPLGRDNLRALAVVGCDGDNYGKIAMYRFPEGRQVYGPSQIDTLIDQDTEISQQMTLWDQAGSEVKRGNVIILPVGDMLLYIQSVYLSSSTRLKIPELKRLIVSQGEIVAMAPSLEEAFEKLETKIKARIERQRQRFPLPGPEPQNSVKGPAEQPTGGNAGGEIVPPPPAGGKGEMSPSEGGGERDEQQLTPSSKGGEASPPSSTPENEPVREPAPATVI